MTEYDSTLSKYGYSIPLNQLTSEQLRIHKNNLSIIPYVDPKKVAKYGNNVEPISI